MSDFLAVFRFSRCRSLLLAVMFFVIGCAFAQRTPPAKNDHCISGIVTFTAGVNGDLKACGEILQTDPKLAAQLDSVTHLLAHQQDQLARLTKSVNAVGSNLDLAKQVQMLQALVVKLGTNAESAPARVVHLTTALETVQTGISDFSKSPRDQITLKSQLNGDLGDAIAQLDLSEAVAELKDIRDKLSQIDKTTSETADDVRIIKKDIEVKLHPESVLPAEVQKLYAQGNPLMTELNMFASRWYSGESMARMQQSQQASMANLAAINKLSEERTRQRAAAEEAFDLEMKKAFASALLEYQRLLPELNQWRAQIVKRYPAAADIAPFALVTDKAGLTAELSKSNLLLLQYSRSPNPLPSLVDPNLPLLTSIRRLAIKLPQAEADARRVQAEKLRASVPPPVVMQPTAPAPATGGDDTPRREFFADLEPRAMAWQNGVKKYYPDFEVTDFSGVTTGSELQAAVMKFNGRVMKVSGEVQAQMQSAAH